MGSSSSKGKNINAPNRPVANVNNNDVTGYPQKNVVDKRGEDVLFGEKAPNVDYTKDFGRQSPLKSIEPNRKENKKDRKEREKSSKTLASASSKRNTVSALQFENDSDVDDDIDEVLRIPLGGDVSKHKKNKDKRNNNEKFQNNYENEYESQSQRYDEDLPETYAQRLQRKQYKLQQDLLIREKTIMRSSQEWDRDEDNRGNEMEIDSPGKGGFDPSKFRQVNKNQDVKTDMFTTVNDDASSIDLKTPRYLQTTGQDLDEVEYDRRGNSPVKRLPSYNQSELDLMQQLEDDIL